jgi:hypothetical protein
MVVTNQRNQRNEEGEQRVTMELLRQRREIIVRMTKTMMMTMTTTNLMIEAMVELKLIEVMEDVLSHNRMAFLAHNRVQATTIDAVLDCKRQGKKMLKLLTHRATILQMAVAMNRVEFLSQIWVEQRYVVRVESEQRNKRIKSEQLQCRVRVKKGTREVQNA